MKKKRKWFTDPKASEIQGAQASLATVAMEAVMGFVLSRAPPAITIPHRQHAQRAPAWHGNNRRGIELKTGEKN